MNIPLLTTIAALLLAGCSAPVPVSPSFTQAEELEVCGYLVPGKFPTLTTLHSSFVVVALTPVVARNLEHLLQGPSSRITCARHRGTFAELMERGRILATSLSASRGGISVSNF